MKSSGINSIRPSNNSQFQGLTNSILESYKDKPMNNLPPLQSNVVSKEIHHQSISRALNTISEIVSSTLGPYGSNTLIVDQYRNHIATKDGYTVLQRIMFLQETASMVLDNVRSISRALVRKVGDGSTSSVVMANSLYQSLLESKVTEYYAPGIIQVCLNLCAEEIAKEIKLVARQIKCNEDILNIATISANNNISVGKIIADAYSLSLTTPNITVDISDSFETTAERIDGYRVFRGMIHDSFANKLGIDGAIKTTCELKDVSVLIYGDILDTYTFNNFVSPILNKHLEQGIPLVVICKQYADDIFQSIVQWRTKSVGANVLFIDHAVNTKRGGARLGDLATILNCDVLNHNAKSEDVVLGYASKVVSTPSETVFFTNHDEYSPEPALERAKSLEEQLERIDKGRDADNLSEDLTELRLRIRALRGNEVIIKVGGNTEEEKRTQHYLIEDAVLAVKAAVESGIVEGLNFTAMRILNNKFDAIVEAVHTNAITCTNLKSEKLYSLISSILTDISNAYFNATAIVFNNARETTDIITNCLSDGVCYDLISKKIYTPSTTPVVNPVNTDIEVLKGAASLVGLFITSNQTLITRATMGNGQD